MEEKSLKDSILYQRRFEKKSGLSVFYWVLLTLFLAAILFRVYWTTNYFCVTVDGSSMNPTLVTSEKLLVRYGSDAERGDIVIVDVRSYKEDPAKKELVAQNIDAGTNYLIKRLIAIEGDKVRCVNGTVQIRYAGKEYGEDEWDTHPSEKYILNGKNKNFEEYEVGEGEIFFLGDNRCNSLDSRYKEDTSHLKQLYKAEDICGVLSDWAYENRKTIAKIFTVEDWISDSLYYLKKSLF